MNGRVRWLAVVSLLALAVSVSPATAHVIPTGEEAVLDGPVHPFPGVTVTLERSLFDRIVVSNSARTPLVVSGPSGIPFVRVSAAGVDGDLSSPDWNPGGPPATGWRHITDQPVWGWFDPRLRPRASPGAWQIPVTSGDRTVFVRGHIHKYVVAGEWDTAIDAASLSSLAGLGMATVDAGAASLTAVYGGTHTIEVLGPGGEPLVRLDAAGVTVNTASPTWVLDEQAAGREPDDPVGVMLPPRWAPPPALPVQWIEPRIAYPLHHPSTARVVAHWRVPVLEDGRGSQITGTIAWQPYPVEGSGALSSPGAQAAVVGGVAALVGGAWLGYRRRRA